MGAECQKTRPTDLRRCCNPQVNPNKGTTHRYIPRPHNERRATTTDWPTTIGETSKHRHSLRLPAKIQDQGKTREFIELLLPCCNGTTARTDTTHNYSKNINCTRTPSCLRPSTVSQVQNVSRPAPTHATPDLLTFGGCLPQQKKSWLLLRDQAAWRAKRACQSQQPLPTTANRKPMFTSRSARRHYDG